MKEEGHTSLRNVLQSEPLNEGDKKVLLVDVSC